MAKKKFTLEIEVDTYEDGQFSPTIHVAGMMKFIKQAMPTKEKQDLLDEYAKLWVFNQLGIEEYPVKQN